MHDLDDTTATGPTRPSGTGPVDRMLGLDTALPLAASLLVVALVGWLWARRAAYPFDLEWMEGGMLAHAWRIQRGLPLYVEPGPEFVPYVYPPGYATLLAVLGWVFGLTPLLGRVVSMVGSVAAAAAAGFIVVRHGGHRVPALVAAATFLGAWPATGAFYDLVRPDGLMMGLLAWSVALALERHPRAPYAAAALLVLAFLCKHNAALFGVPLALGIGLRDGRAAAARFVAAAVLPALLAVAWFQWRSDGRFLQYLLAVPASHPRDWARVWPVMFQELGSPLPFVAAIVAAAAMWLGVGQQRTFPRPVTTFLPIGAGMAAAALGTYVPPSQPGLYNVPSGVLFFAFGAIPVSAALYTIGRWIDRLRDGDALGPALSWRGATGISLVLVAGAGAAIMRAHDGGFVNVHIPVVWAAAVAFGVTLDRLRRAWPGDRMRALLVVLATAQLSWLLARIDRERLVPTPGDLAAGERLVAAARSAEGDVLSPFAAWIPVYAGKPPSLHYMGVWDLEAPGGPFPDARPALLEAVAAHRWPMVLFGNSRFPYGVNKAYEELELVVEPGDPALSPKTGWGARPTRVMVPRSP